MSRIISLIAHLPDPRGPLSFPLLLQMDREYCVALELIHKQAPRLLLASSTHAW